MSQDVRKTWDEPSKGWDFSFLLFLNLVNNISFGDSFFPSFLGGMETITMMVLSIDASMIL